RFAWYLRCIQSLGQALAHAVNQAGDPSAQRARRDREARDLRLELLDTFETVAGSDEEMNRDLEAARGPSEKSAGSPRKPAARGPRWLAQADAPTKARSDACKFGQGDSDSARRAADALEKAHADVTATPQTPRDTPEVNRVEGRMLLEMREVKKY